MPDKLKCPPEFGWIQPGVKAKVKEDAWHARGIYDPIEITGHPYYSNDAADEWLVSYTPDYCLLMYCRELEPL